MLVRMRRERISFALLVGMQAGAAALENSMEVPQKIKNRTILRPSNCTARYLPKGYRCAFLKGYRHPNVYSSTINNSQSRERAQCPLTDEWIKKVWGYLAMKENEILTLATTWMELECIMLSEICQSEKDMT